MAKFYIAIFLYVAVLSNYANGKSWVIPENWSPSQAGQISRTPDLTNSIYATEQKAHYIYEYSKLLAKVVIL